LYGIVDAGVEALDVSEASGVKGAAVDVIEEGDVAVVCSPAPSGKLRPRRRNLKAHHDLLRAVSEATAVLPMAFGVLADDEAEVRDFLADHEATLAERLDLVRGHVECTLRVRWNVDDIFNYFVERYDDLRETRDAFFGDGASASRGEMIQLGEQFETLLQAERQAHLATVEEHLDDVCRAVEVQEPKDETEVLNVACLVPRGEVDAFEDAVHAAADAFDDEFLFKYTDPIAPYSFANVDFEGYR
jgi:hypothetical protein